MFTTTALPTAGVRKQAPPPRSTTACRISRLDSFHSPRQDIEPSSWRNYSTKRQYAAMSFKTNQLGKDRLASNDHIPTTQFSSGTVDQLPWRSLAREIRSAAPVESLAQTLLLTADGGRAARRRGQAQFREKLPLRRPGGLPFLPGQHDGLRRGHWKSPPWTIP